MLRQRSISAVLIVAAAVIPAVLGHPILTIAVAVLAAISVFEFCRAVRVQGVNPETTLAMTVGALVILAIGFKVPGSGFAAIATLSVLAVLATGIVRGTIAGATRDAAFSIAPVVYIAVPLAHVPLIRNLGDTASAGWLESVNNLSLTDQSAVGLGWLVLIVAATWLTDTAAFLGGRSFGRNKLAPTLSPKKTVEGALSGVVAGAVAAGLLSSLLGLPIPVYVGAIIGLVLSIVGQVGDLTESLIKRDLGVKDMGNTIPGHGGMLDRIDALLFTLPVGYYLILLALEVNWP